MSLSLFVRQQINNAGFPYIYRQLAKDKILSALRSVRLNKKTAKNLYCPKSGLVMGVRPNRPAAGRPKLSEETIYLCSVLNSVWMQAFNKKGRLNRRGHTETAFIKFAAPIMRKVEIYNALDNLNKYRRYVNRQSKIIDKRGSIFVTMPQK